jgi:hypothetical protein
VAALVELQSELGLLPRAAAATRDILASMAASSFCAPESEVESMDDFLEQAHAAGVCDADTPTTAAATRGAPRTRMEPRAKNPTR